MSKTPHPVILNNGGRIVIHHRGPTYHIFDSEINELVFPDVKRAKKRKLDAIQPVPQPDPVPAPVPDPVPEAQPETRVEAAVPQARRKAKPRISIIQPQSKVDDIVEEPVDLSHELWAQYQREKAAVYEKYGRRRRAGERILRLRELGLIWFKYNAINEAAMRSLFAASFA